MTKQKPKPASRCFFVSDGHEDVTDSRLAPDVVVDLSPVMITLIWSIVALALSLASFTALVGFALALTVEDAGAGGLLD